MPEEEMVNGGVLVSIGNTEVGMRVVESEATLKTGNKIKNNSNVIQGNFGRKAVVAQAA